MLQHQGRTPNTLHVKCIQITEPEFHWFRTFRYIHNSIEYSKWCIVNVIYNNYLHYIGC